MLSLSCGVPAFQQAESCGSSQPSLGKYRNSSAAQFFFPLPDFLILGAFPRNLCWTDVVQLQIQVSSFFSWDYCWFSAYMSSLGRISATMILPAPNTTGWFPTGVQVSPWPSPACVEALPLVRNHLCINCKVNTEDVWVSFPLSRPEWLRKLSMLWDISQFSRKLNKGLIVSIKIIPIVHYTRFLIFFLLLLHIFGRWIKEAT